MYYMNSEVAIELLLKLETVQREEQDGEVRSEATS